MQHSASLEFDRTFRGIHIVSWNKIFPQEIARFASRGRKRVKDAEEFFSRTRRALLKFSRIRPISGRGAGDLGMFAPDGRLRFKETASLVPAPRPDLIWIIHGYAADRTYTFYASRERARVKKKGDARVFAMLSPSRKHDPVRVAFAKLYSDHVAFEITADRIF